MWIKYFKKESQQYYLLIRLLIELDGNCIHTIAFYINKNTKHNHCFNNNNDNKINKISCYSARWL